MENKRKKTTLPTNDTVKDYVLINHDCLVKIFQYLPIFDRVRCERVCKLWLEASRASWYNFKKLDLQYNTWGNVEKLENHLFLVENVLSRSGENITHLDLSRVPWKISRHTNSLKMLEKCPNLKELNLRHVLVGVPQLKFLVKHCKNIESLELSSITNNCNDEFLGDHVFAKLKLRCLHLSDMSSKLNGSCLKKLSPEVIEEISLYSCHSFDLKFMISHFPTFKKLHTLELQRTFLDNYFLFPKVTRENDVKLLFKALKELDNLKVLDISGNYQYVNDDSITELIPLRDRLLTLNISGTYLTDFGISVIVKYSNIQNLLIGCLYRVTGVGLRNISSLKTLHCYSCSVIEENNLIRVLNNSENLEKLDISYCRKITKKFVDNVKSVISCRANNISLTIVARCTEIKEIDIPTDTQLSK